MTGKRFNFHIDEIGIYYYICDSSKKGDDRIILEFDSKFDAMEVCELLNELHEEKQHLQRRCEAMQEEIEILSEENEQLKSDNKVYVKRYSELFDEYKKNKKENEELKSIKKFAEIHGINIFKIDEAFQKCWNDNGKLIKEIEQLQQQNADWETSFDICKHYKEAYSTEIVKIKQTIKDMMENERTELGRSVLKQLWEAIQ